jgi:hypothetical protein
MMNRHHTRDNNFNYKGPSVMNSQECECLLTGFPNTRLSYETTIHKNDNPSLFSGGYKCFILPKGKRCIVWVTEWKRNKIVAVIDILGANNYQGSLTPVIRKFHQENGWYPGSIRMYDACMDHSLVYGSVFGGVLFRMNNASASASAFDKTFFSIHTVYWYKGNPVQSLSLSGHVRLCERIFDEGDIRQIAYTKQNSIIFGLPILCHTEKDVDAMILELPYPVFAIQYRFENNTRVYQQLLQSGRERNDERRNVAPPQYHRSSIAPTPTLSTPTPTPTPTLPTSRHPIEFIPPPDDMLTNIQAVFMVRPNIQNDIYELFVNTTNNRANELVFHNFAHISSYKTSVMMNRVFRNIVENERLDAQEESEDETEFENTDPDKYVSLHKEFLMMCRFNKRFCRWVPVQFLVSQSTSNNHNHNHNHNHNQIITDHQVKQHEMRYLKYKRK